MKKTGFEYISKREVYLPVMTMMNNLNYCFAKVVKDCEIESDSQDLRLVVISAVNHQLKGFAWLFAAINVVTHSSSRFEDWKDEIDNHSDWLTSEVAQLAMTDNLRKTLAIQVHFAIDNFIDGLYNGNFGIRSASGFIPRVEKVVNEFSLKAYVLSALKALGYMRNCFHNNGIHRNASSKLKLGSKRFDFIKGQSVNYSIKDLLWVVDYSVKALCEIIESDQLMAYIKVLEDKGAVAISD